MDILIGGHQLFLGSGFVLAVSMEGWLGLDNKLILGLIGLNSLFRVGSFDALKDVH